MPPPEAAACARACGLRQQAASSPAASSEQTPGSSGGTAPSRLERPKSARRRAAEALLHRRFSGTGLAALAEGSGGLASSIDGRPAKRQRTEHVAVRVAACSDCCTHGCHSAAAAAADEAWCSQDVSLPPMDWPAVLQAVKGEADVAVDAAAGVHTLPGGVRVHVVSRAEELPGALAALRHSMQDSCIAIDLEWKPEGWAGAGPKPNRVALVQLASDSVAVLVRVSSLGFRMPPPLRAFLSDPELTLVGFSWDGADEGKMVQTFGAGRALFARFVDLQQVGESLGYHGLGLGALTKQVLGFEPPKDRKVTMSNWEARALSAKQIQYAALDALITGHIFRGLRLWHASPSACTSCRQLLGAVLPAPNWRCHDCERSFSSRAALMSHRQQKRHRTSPGVCGECGRVQTAATP